MPLLEYFRVLIEWLVRTYCMAQNCCVGGAYLQGSPRWLVRPQDRAAMVPPGLGASYNTRGLAVACYDGAGMTAMRWTVPLHTPQGRRKWQKMETILNSWMWTVVGLTVRGSANTTRTKIWTAVAVQAQATGAGLNGGTVYIAGD